jgi:hypothetical protein
VTPDRQLTNVLIAKNSSTVHEPVLRFLSAAASGDAALLRMSLARTPGRAREHPVSTAAAPR